MDWKPETRERKSAKMTSSITGPTLADDTERSTFLNNCEVFATHRPGFPPLDSGLLILSCARVFVVTISGAKIQKGLSFPGLHIPDLCPAVHCPGRIVGLGLVGTQSPSPDSAANAASAGRNGGGTHEQATNRGTFPSPNP